MKNKRVGFDMRQQKSHEEPSRLQGPLSWLPVGCFLVGTDVPWLCVLCRIKCLSAGWHSRSNRFAETRAFLCLRQIQPFILFAASLRLFPAATQPSQMPPVADAVLGRGKIYSGEDGIRDGGIGDGSTTVAANQRVFGGA